MVPIKVFLKFRGRNEKRKKKRKMQQNVKAHLEFEIKFNGKIYNLFHDIENQILHDLCVHFLSSWSSFRFARFPATKFEIFPAMKFEIYLWRTRHHKLALVIVWKLPRCRITIFLYSFLRLKKPSITIIQIFNYNKLRKKVEKSFINDDNII